MNRTFVAATIAVVGGSSSFAQEANWGRWFVGFDAGYVWRSETSSADGRVDSAGPLAEVSAGRWWVFDAAALGVEAGLSFGGASLALSSPGGGGATPWEYNYSETITASARLKAGLPIGNALPYAAAGLQYIHSADRFRWLPSGETATGTENSLGGTLAVGLEVALSPQISVTAEYGLNLKFPQSSRTTAFAGHGGKVGVNYYLD